MARIAVVIIVLQALVVLGVCALFFLLGVAGQASFSVLGAGSITNGPQVALATATVAVVVVAAAGATAVGLWRGRGAATIAGFALEIAWAAAVVFGVNGPAYTAVEVAILVSPAPLVAALLLAGGLKR